MKTWIYGFAFALFPIFALVSEAKPSEKKAGQEVSPTKVVVYKSPTCGCCVKWEEHLKANGFAVESVSTDTLGAKKKELGVPSALHSCHTAVVNGYVVEGHVPASSIKKLLDSKSTLKGLAVPGMPMGSPGMEGPRKDSYNVIGFDKQGKQTVFEKF